MSELRFQKALILLGMQDSRSKVQFRTFDMKKIYGGLLVQTYDTALSDGAVCVTAKKPSDEEMRALEFNYKVAKHAHSSAVVIGNAGETLGLGSGQSNRMLAFRFAVELAGDRTQGAVIASDSGLLTLETLEECKDLGITAVIQTGAPDSKVIKLCDKYGISVICTQLRHFKA